jgi:Zn-dependent M28 family amino/carboxypeptidase
MARRRHLPSSLAIAAAFAVAATTALLAAGGCRMNSPSSMTQMPGQSHAGPLPPLTAEESELAAGLRRHVQRIAGEIGDRNVWRYDELNAAADHISATLRDLGYEVTEQPFESAGKTVRNLAVEQRGAAAADEILVVGAHYDSVHGCPAANDNGTGVAGVLEMARVMAKDAPAKRTVRFVLFVNEEPPFFQGEQMGSLVYARACKARGERVVGMISVETIGYYSDAPGSQKYPPPYDRMFPDVGNYIGFVGDDSSAALVRDAIGSFRRHTQFPSQGLAAPAAVTGIGWSDHWAFWQVGYPALMVTDTAPFRYPHYHEATDTPDKIDYDRTARVVAGIIRVTRELADR